VTPPATPSQTVGPFFSFALCREPRHELVAPGSPGALRLAGQVVDGAGEPVTDALIEVWQRALGWGRCATDDRGRYAFWLRVPPARGELAPQLELLLFARGLLRHLVTRVYFPGEPANDVDPLLRSLPPAERRTLVAAVDGAGLRLDLRLQGEGQTTFFEP
jgi:protocatechuate 3,4-dioxygenase alpha subunit